MSHTQVNASGVTNIDNLVFYMSGNSLLRLTNVAQVRLNRQVTWDVYDLGSLLDLSGVTNVVGNGQTLYVRPSSGGKVDLRRAQFTNADTYFQAQGAGSVLDLSGLSGELRARPGGAAQLNVQKGGRVDLGAVVGASGFDLQVDGVTSVLPLEQWGWITNGQLRVTGGAQVNAAGVTNIDDTVIYLTSGSLLRLTNVTQIKLNRQVTWDVYDAGSLLDLSGVTNVVGNAQSLYARAYDGGKVDLRRAHFTNADTYFLAQGIGSVLDLSGLSGELRARAGGSGQIYAMAGGRVTVGPVVGASGLDLRLDGATSVFPVEQLGWATNCTLRLYGVTNDLAALRRMDRSSLDLRQGAQVNAAGVTNIDDTVIYLTSGSLLRLTNVTQIKLNRQVTWDVYDAGSLLDLSGVTNVVGNAQSLYARAYDGGKVDLRRAQFAGNHLYALATGAGSVVDLSGLNGTWQSASSSSLEAGSGGAILIPNQTQLDGCNVTLRAPMGLTYTQLVSITHATITIDGFQADFRNLLDLTGSTVTYRNGGSAIFSAPTILLQPQDQVTAIGNTATFQTLVSRQLPVSYQWFFQDTRLKGETNSTLSLVDVQPDRGGEYFATVSNSAGAVTSRAASLTVITNPACAVRPVGLVAWWKGDGTATDSAGTNHGTLQNGAGFASGRVGAAFGLDGINDYVQAAVLDPGTFQQGLTLQVWMRSSGSSIYAMFIKAYDDLGNRYDSGAQLGLDNDGRVRLDIGYLTSSYVVASNPKYILDGGWHHVVGTYDGTNAIVWVDGIPGSPAFVGHPAGTSVHPVVLGQDTAAGNRFFSGIIDEAAIFSRALSSIEIAAIYAAGAAGMCGGQDKPSILQQPQSVSALWGGTAEFQVVAASALPPSYQWRLNGSPAAGGTNSTLLLADVQLAQAGDYDVVVANFSGSVTSAVAVLTVITNIPDLRPSLLTSAPTAQSGSPVTVSWVTTNAGNASAIAPWQESLSLADNPAGLNATPLVTLAAGASLAAGGSGARSQSVILPAGLSGTYWLVLRVDSANQVAEGYGETNNVAVTPVVISSPDLEVRRLTSAATAVFGQPFGVSWVVTNTGTGPAQGNWSDRVWFSAASNSLAGATPLVVAANVSSLSVPGSYTNSTTVAVPLNAQSQPGSYWLVVQADANQALPEMNEGNNLLSVPLSLALPPLPDLTVGQCVAPISGMSGGTLQVRWVVTNLGPAGVTDGVWRETLSLTNSETGATPVLLGTFTVTNTLPAGGWLARMQSVTVPVDSETGNLRFVVVVDSAAEIVEANETNNLAVATNVTVVPAVLTLSAPTSLAEGASVLASVTRNGSRATALTVTVTNSDGSEISFDQSLLTSAVTVTIPAGAASANFLVRALADGVVDGSRMVTLAVAATNFTGAAANVTVLDVDIPKLTLAMPGTLVEGLTNTASVTRELVSAQPLTVTLTAAGNNRLKVPSSVVIAGGATQAVFAVWANENFLVEGDRICTVSAQAVGHTSASANLTLLDNDLPGTTVRLAFASTNISEGGGTQATRGTVSRVPETSEAVLVELDNGNPGAIWVPQFLSIPPWQSEVSFFVAAWDNVDVNAPVVVEVTPYVLDSVTGARLVELPPVAITVRDNDGPTLRLTLARKLAPEGQANASTGTVTRNTGTNGALVVSLSSSDLSEATVPASVTISNGLNSASFAVASVNDGTNDGSQSVTITASAGGYVSGSDFLVVSDTDLPDLTLRLESVPTVADAESWQQVTYLVENQGVALAGSNVVRLFLSRTAAGSYDVGLGEFGVIPIPPGGYYRQTVTVRMPRETGSYWLVAVANAANQFVELIPENNKAVSALPIQVVPAYTATVTATPHTLLMGAPVSLSGQAFLRGGATPAAEVLVNLWVMRGDTNGMRRVISALTGKDGRFSTSLLPLPGEAGLYLVGAAHPGEASAPAQDSFRWLGMQAEPASVSLRLAEQSSVSSHVQLRNMSGVPLHVLGVVVSGVSANLAVTATVPGGTMASNGTMQLSFNMIALDASVRQAQATLVVTNAEGANVSVPLFITVDLLVPDLLAEPGELVRGVLRGGQALVEFEVVNKGGRETGPITVSLPPLPWLSLVSTNPLPSLPAGRAGTNRVTLLLTPPLDAPLSEFTGSLALNCGNGGAGLAVPYRFRALSDNRAPLVVFAEDEYTFYATGAPLVSNAVVTVTDALSGAALTNGVTDPNGKFAAGLLPEGYYTVLVTATNHSEYRGTHLVAAGQTNEVHAFISRQAVRYTWTVVPTEIEDRYRITIQTTFETKVPMPVITVQPALIDLAEFTQPVTQIQMTITNDGLVAGLEATITFDEHPLWEVRPVVTNLGTLWASSGLTIPVEIRRKAATADCHVPCQFFGRVAWTLVSGGNRYGYNAPVTLINAWTNCACPGVPVGPPGIPPGGWVGGGGGGGGSGGVTPVYNPPPVFTPPPRCVPHLDGVCAKVRLQLNQEAVLSREAFKATLEIENQTAGALSNVLVQLEIRDAGGFIVPAEIFGIHAPMLSGGLSDVNGTGVVGSGYTGAAEWIIVPSVDAAPDTNRTYTVGGTLSYVDKGALVQVPLAATPIVVHPLPQLKLDYFHERDVFADDPWTRGVVEPSIPYNLAVMVQNTGRGKAKNLRIVSAQPKIIENESGLLIDFRVIATEVAGQNMTPTLTAPFGDLAPGETKIARWLLTSTLQGQFTEYTNWFEHLDGMGNPRLAIITNVAIHEMIHLVQAGGAFADGLPDFLVNEVDDAPWDLPDTLYFSGGGKASVAQVLNASVTGSPASGAVTLAATMPAGWVYLRVLEPGAGAYRLSRVVRSDGIEIPFGTNVWVTDRTFGDPLDQPERTNRLHLLDYNSPGSYTLYFEMPPPRDTNAPSSQVAAMPPDSYERIPLTWSGADNPGGSGLAAFDIWVSDNGTPFTRWLNQTTLRSAVYQGAFGHSYAFYSTALDNEGNLEAASGTPDATTVVSRTNRAPVMAALGTQMIDEGQTLVVNLPASDPDGDALSFELLGFVPAGLGLHPATGRLTWSTGEGNGPSTNIVTVRVEDSGSPRLAATNTVTLVVREVNTPPTLAELPDYDVKEGQ